MVQYTGTLTMFGRHPERYTAFGVPPLLVGTGYTVTKSWYTTTALSRSVCSACLVLLAVNLRPMRQTHRHLINDKPLSPSSSNVLCSGGGRVDKSEAFAADKCAAREERLSSSIRVSNPPTLYWPAGHQVPGRSLNCSVGNGSMTDDDRVVLTSMRLPDSSSYIPFTDQVPGVFSHAFNACQAREASHARGPRVRQLQRCKLDPEECCQRPMPRKLKDGWVDCEAR